MTKKLENFDLSYYSQIGKFTNEFEKRNFDRVRDYFNQLSREEIAEKIVAYAGLNEKYVNYCLTPCEMWFRRFDHYCYVANGQRVVDDNIDDLQGVYEQGEFCEMVNPKIEVDYVNKYYFWMMLLKARIDQIPDQIQQNEERNIAWIRDSFTSCED